MAVEEENSEDVDLRSMDLVEWPEDRDPLMEFELPRGLDTEKGRLKKGVLRLPLGKDSEPLAKLSRADPGAATTAMLAALIKSLGGQSVDASDIQRMSSRDRAHLGKLFREQLPGPRFEVEADCAACGRGGTVKVDMARFLTPT